MKRIATTQDRKHIVEMTDTEAIELGLLSYEEEQRALSNLVCEGMQVALLKYVQEKRDKEKKLCPTTGQH